MLPYARQIIDEDDIQSVVEALRSDWLTTGPKVGEFEGALAEVTGASDVISVNSGTAALHAAMHALGIGPGDEVIVPAITFVATANCVLYVGAKPVFADINPTNLLIDVESVRHRITPATRAVIAMDYAGQPCDYRALKTLCDQYEIALVADAAHSLGATCENVPVGSLADITTFSFHAIKAITTAEGGAAVTNNPEYAKRMRIFRNHGITMDWADRERKGQWQYEMDSLGFNYRLSDIQCALGISQLRKLKTQIERRSEIAAHYDASLSGLAGVIPLMRRDDIRHAWHLYVVRILSGKTRTDRDAVYTRMRAKEVGVNVHYTPVYLHPYYKKLLGDFTGHCPMAETVASEILTLPIFPRMNGTDVDRVVDALLESIGNA